MNITFQLIEHISNLLCMLFLARILLQLGQVDFNNPLSQLVNKITAPAINLCRKVISDIGRFNLASLVIASIIILFKFILIVHLSEQAAPPKFYVISTLIGFPAKAPLAGLVMNFVTLLTILFIGLMITSFMSGGQYNPAAAFFHQITNPVLQPLRKIIPPIGGSLDITPMIVLFVLIYGQGFLMNLMAQLLV